MATSKLKAAILIVSTTASLDPSTDASSAVLTEVLATEGGGKWEVTDTKIVGDVITQIQSQITTWTDSYEAPNLVITTGGTGFAVSDSTPEAVQPLLHKQAPGLVHGMMSASLSVTSFAMMSRPTAGVRNKTVIVTLPGSPKGARENLSAILKTLPHACFQAAGADSRSLHSGGVKKLEADAGISGTSGAAVTSSAAATAGGSHSHRHRHHHGHGHGHGGGSGCGHHGHGGGGEGGGPIRHTTESTTSNPLSNDPQLGASRRYRKSPYPMLPVPEALSLIQKHTPAPTVITVPLTADYLYGTNASTIGTALAEDVIAQENVPPFRASIVDGYAVVVPEGGDMRGTFPVLSVSHAAPAADPSVAAADGDKAGAVQILKAGEITRITTGAPLPPGATAVIMVEDTLLTSTTATEESTVQILAQDVKPGDNIRQIGSDVASGTVILRKGDTISNVGGEVGLLASVGVREIKVYKKPIIGILSTGDELVEATVSDGRAEEGGGTLRYGQVRDTNRPTLLRAATGSGFKTVDLGIAPDTPSGLESVLRAALMGPTAVDVLVTTGGVSMGELDLLKPTIERSMGGTIHFGRVAMKPGKPTTFATVPVKDVVAGVEGKTGTPPTTTKRNERIVFSLPGNPASALVTFYLFVVPSLHHFCGADPADAGCTRLDVVLGHDFPLDAARPEYHRAHVEVERVEGGKQGARLVATSTGFQRSSAVGSLKRANALLELPAGEEMLKKGAVVTALLVGEL